MSLDLTPPPDREHQQRDDDPAVASARSGSSLAPMPRYAPAHWSFWSYLWRYSLFSVPFAAMGMYFGMLDSTGYKDLAGVDMLINIVMFGVMFVIIGLVLACGAALVVFIVTTPRRRLWSAHRAAGWTTAQCTDAHRIRRRRAHTLKMEARLRELGLEPTQLQSTVPPSSAPTRESDKPSGRRAAQPRWASAWRRVRTPAVFATVLVMLVFFFTVAFSPLLDRIDVQTVRCEIVSADPGTASGGSRGSASTAYVRIETSCGTIDVSRGVNFENREEVASSIEPGSEYDFDIGWYSRVVAKDILRGPPTADHYRLVNAP